MAATGANAGLYNTLTTSTNNNIDNTQYLTRLDYALGQNDHFSGRYFYNQDNFQRPFTAPLGFYAANLFRNQSLTLSDAHVLLAHAHRRGVFQLLPRGAHANS